MSPTLKDSLMVVQIISFTSQTPVQCGHLFSFCSAFVKSLKLLMCKLNIWVSRLVVRTRMDLQPGRASEIR